MVFVEVPDLVRGAASGDPTSWDELVRRYGRLVWTVARSRGLDPNDASDVAQTTWLRLAERLSTIRQPERVAAWLVTTAKNEAIRVSQAARRTVPVHSPRTTDVPRAVEDRIVERETRAALWNAFESLPSGCKTLLRLLINEPVPSYTEISEALGMPVGSIGPTRSRCLSRLREKATRLDETHPCAPRPRPAR